MFVCLVPRPIGELVASPSSNIRINLPKKYNQI
jgi:hypothetical protein